MLFGLFMESKTHAFSSRRCGYSVVLLKFVVYYTSIVAELWRDPTTT